MSSIILIVLILLILFGLFMITSKCEHLSNNEDIIPKIIHQIWLGPNEPPIKYMKQWENDYIKLYPDFKYIFWNEEKIEKDLIWPDKIKKIYDIEKTYYGKSDIARLIILKQYGGIYIDSDSVWVNNKNLNDIIIKAYNEKTNIFACKEPDKDYVANGVIGSSKNNKSLLFIIDYLDKIYNKYEELRNRLRPWEVTGPLLLNKIVENSYPMTVLPSIYFYPFDCII